MIDVTAASAAEQTRDPAVLARIRSCTGLFFGGGDQRRLVLAFLGPDGKGTPALDALREVYRRGGLIAGSSAGASALGVRMICSYGLPIDTLDFGLAAAAHDRGALVSLGFGLFHAGLIDQHFDTFDGRIARLPAP